MSEPKTPLMRGNQQTKEARGAMKNIYRPQYFERFKSWTDILNQFGVIQPQASAHQRLQAYETWPDPKYMFATMGGYGNPDVWVVWSENGKTSQVIYKEFDYFSKNRFQKLWKPETFSGEDLQAEWNFNIKINPYATLLPAIDWLHWLKSQQENTC